MSDTNSDSEAENGTDNAPSSLAALRSQHLERLIEEPRWNTPNDADFHERVLARQYRFSDGDVRNLQSIKYASSSTSSMAVSVATTRSSAFHGPQSAGYPPSLVSNSTWHSGQSVRTSRADSVLDLPVLEEDSEGALEVVSTRPVTRVLVCSFTFLGCGFTSRNLEEWETHCKSHFFKDDTERLPRSVVCPFHCDWSRTAEAGEQAWKARTVHIWGQHRDSDLVDTSRRPDSALIQHLWRTGIIDNAQQKELRMNGRLTGQVFLRSAGSVHEDRIRRRPHTARRS